MQTYLELSAEMVREPKIQQAFAYWEAVRGHRPMPSRADIDALDLRFCLGWVCLVDVLHEPHRRYRFRLDGSHLARLTGWDLTGRYVDELEREDYRDFALMVYDRVVETKAPMFVSDLEQWSDRGYLMESVTLPLSNNALDVTGRMDVIIPTEVPIDRSSTARLCPDISR